MSLYLDHSKRGDGLSFPPAELFFVTTSHLLSICIVLLVINLVPHANLVLAVLYQLSYEDPYMENRPLIVCQSMKEMKHTLKWIVNCRNTNEMNMWPSHLNRNLNNCQVARKKKSQFSGLQRDTEPMASAVALQYSTSWAMKTHTLGAGQFIEFINPWTGMKHRMKLCELWELYKCNEYVAIAAART